MKFQGAEQALRFSYNMADREIISKPKLEPGINSTSQEGLSPHELHAQAALIQQALSRLPILEQSAVRAFLAPEPESSQATLQAVEELWPRVQGRVPSKTAAYEFLRLWMRRGDCSQPRFFRLCKEYGVGRHKGGRFRGDMGTVFYPAYLRGIQLLEADLFRDGGLEKK